MGPKAWRRGFLGGFAALLLAVGGQFATSQVSERSSCPSRRPQTPIAQSLIEKLSPPESRTLTQRVALALLSAVLWNTCT